MLSSGCTGPCLAPVRHSPLVGECRETHRLGKLASAGRKKDASDFDLSFALGLLLGSGQFAFDKSGNLPIVGDLADKLSETRIGWLN